MPRGQLDQRQPQTSEVNSRPAPQGPWLRGHHLLHVLEQEEPQCVWPWGCREPCAWTARLVCEEDLDMWDVFIMILTEKRSFKLWQPKRRKVGQYFTGVINPDIFIADVSVSVCEQQWNSP